MKNSKHHGFTLVELIVVIAIVAILAATIVVGYQQFINQAEASVAMQETNRMRTEIEGYFLDGTTYTNTRTYEIGNTDVYADYDITIGHDFVSNTFRFVLEDHADSGTGPNPLKKSIYMKDALRAIIDTILDDVTVADSAQEEAYDPGTLVIDIKDFYTDEVTFLYYHTNGITLTWTIQLTINEI